MRACSWATRGAHDPFVGRRHTPAARSPQWVSYTTRERGACPRVVRLTAPVRARAERAWGHGERVVAVPQHATRRCGGCAGMVWRWAREPAKTVHASHVDDEACVSFCMLWAGRENQRTRVQIGTLVATITTLRQFHLPRAVLGVFSCHGHTMATPKLKLKKNKEGCEVGVITTQLNSRGEDFF